ncbi:UDP-N-acetylmuramate dehydrogenase [Patescibacteria group bacterium]|nr:MAG: UDP-N-acetylmuramate dehydrogenase [Patescibacteria group bacterium]
MEILENIPLAQYTSIRIGGPARFFCIAKSEQDLSEALEFACEKNLSVFMLGGGCNSLFPDKGIDGLVIKMQNTEFKKEDDGKFMVGAGVGLGYLAQESAKAGYSGAEWCAAVPGTVGGAIYGNAGAFGGEMKDIVEEVEYINAKLKTPAYAKASAGKQNSKLKVNECEFGYRESIFKKHPDWIIWRTKIRLKKGDAAQGQERIKQYLSKKRSTQDLISKTAGCTFKNFKLPVDLKFLEHLRKKLEMEENDFKVIIKNGYISAGFLIDRLGLKGKKIGGIQISEIHANFLINTGSATAEDVVIMMSLIKEKIRNHFDIQLQEEIQTIGF